MVTMSQRDRSRPLAVQHNFSDDEIEHGLKVVRLYASLRLGVRDASQPNEHCAS
jgi:hypothetical protein